MILPAVPKSLAAGLSRLDAVASTVSLCNANFGAKFRRIGRWRA